MTVKVNKTAIANAKKAIKDNNVDTGSWDGDKLSLQDLKDWAVLIDDSKDSETKEAYSYPIGSDDKLNAKGLSSALGYSNHADTGNPIASKALTTLNNLYKEKKSPKHDPNTYPLKMGAFATKDDSKRLVNGPVMIPGCADCDFARGEKVFNADEVESFCHKFNTFRINDDMHTYGANGEQTGDVVENYTLKRELTETNVLGEEVTYPVGTWMITSKVTNDNTWNDIQEGVLKGYSGTYIPETDAQKLLETLSANKSETDVLADLYSSKRVLIKDLKDPVPVTVSFVDRPCVANAIFTSIKSDDSLVLKAGRSISNATLDKLKKAHETAQNSLNSLKDLLSKAETERIPNTEKSIKEVDDMNEDELKKMIGDAVEKATEESKTELKEVKDEIEALKKEPEEVVEPEPVEKADGSCSGCGSPTKKGDKYCSNCGASTKGEPEPAVKLEEEEVIKDIVDRLEAIDEKLGIDPASKSLESPDKPVEVSTKTKFVSTKKAAEMLAAKKGLI